jgi:hypothetical protein
MLSRFDRIPVAARLLSAVIDGLPTRCRFDGKISQVGSNNFRRLYHRPKNPFLSRHYAMATPSANHSSKAVDTGSAAIIDDSFLTKLSISLTPPAGAPASVRTDVSIQGIPTDTVNINVTGRTFAVSLSVLMVSGLFSTLFEECPPQSGATYYISRSPMLFEHALAYMIDPTYPYPQEAEEEIYGYYQLPRRVAPVKVQSDLSDQRKTVKEVNHNRTRSPPRVCGGSDTCRGRKTRSKSPPGSCKGRKTRSKSPQGRRKRW